MKHLNDLREAVKPEDQGEYDNEGGMAKTQLRGILRDAGHMVEMFSDEQNLPEWVQNKITKSADYLQSAHAYMMNKDDESVAESFKPHMMYDPETGKAYKAEKEEDHLRMKKLGYTHEKPEVKEAAPKVKARSFTPGMYKVKFNGDVTTVKAKDSDDALKKAMKDLGISSFNKSKYMKTASAIEESLDEASLRTKIAKSGGVADKIRDYGRKSGGIDKAAFLKIAAMIDGSESNAKIQSALQKMDTDPRDWVIKTLDDSGFIKGGKVRVTESADLDEDVDFHVRMDYLKDADAKKVAAVLQKAVKGKTIQFKNETDKGATFSAKSSSDVTRITKDIAKISRAANIEIMEKLEVSDGLDAWVKEFQASDAPQFQDQDKEEIRNMAIAAYLAAKRRAKGSTDTKESTKAYGKSMDDIKKKNISKKDKDKLKKLADLMKK
jgi:putative intracellular protease/amidase